jgi:hypothetical protein
MAENAEATPVDLSDEFFDSLPEGPAPMKKQKKTQKTGQKSAGHSESQYRRQERHDERPYRQTFGERRDFDERRQNFREPKRGLNANRWQAQHCYDAPRYQQRGRGTRGMTRGRPFQRSNRPGPSYRLSPDRQYRQPNPPSREGEERPVSTSTGSETEPRAKPEVPKLPEETMSTRPDLSAKPWLETEIRGRTTARKALIWDLR